MRSEIKVVGISPAIISLLSVAVIITIGSSWFAMRWQIGGTMAEYAPTIEEGGLDTALAAAKLAPDDPLTHLVLGDMEKSSISPEQSTDAINQYKDAARLSPNDYRLWMALGQSLEAAGDAGSAEESFRRASALAPYYAYPHWYLGNFFLRRSRFDEAFVELQIAGDADPSLRPQVFSMVWHAFPGEVDMLKSTVGKGAAGRTALVGFLMEQNSLDAALKVWSDLTSSEKQEQQSAGERLVGTLIANKHYQAALQVLRETRDAGASVPAVGEVYNGGFETEIAKPSNAFDWMLRSSSIAQVAFDTTNKHTGARSLRVVFSAPGKLDFNQISQVVVVEPSTLYELQYFVRSQKLISAETPRVEVVDGTDGRTVLGFSPAAVSGDTDWQRVIVSFKVPPKSEAVTIRITRQPCGSNTGCPIYGTVWYDDFNLQRVGGNPDPNQSGAGTRAPTQRHKP